MGVFTIGLIIARKLNLTRHRYGPFFLELRPKPLQAQWLSRLGRPFLRHILSGVMTTIFLGKDTDIAASFCSSVTF